MYRLGFFLWAYVAYLFSFDRLFIIATVLLVIFLNLGTRQVEQFSAYNVFNQGYQHLLGDLRGERIEAELRHRDVKQDVSASQDRLKLLQQRRAKLEKELELDSIG